MEWTYLADEWEEIASPPGIRGLSEEHLMLLHRSWLWIACAYEWFLREADAGNEKRGRPLHLGDEVRLEDPHWCALYTYYGFLWALIEGFQDRKIELAGRWERMSRP